MRPSVCLGLWLSPLVHYGLSVSLLSLLLSSLLYLWAPFSRPALLRFLCCSGPSEVPNLTSFPAWLPAPPPLPPVSRSPPCLSLFAPLLELQWSRLLLAASRLSALGRQRLRQREAPLDDSRARASLGAVTEDIAHQRLKFKLEFC